MLQKLLLPTESDASRRLGNASCSWRGGVTAQLAHAKVALQQLAPAHAWCAALEGSAPCTSTIHVQAVD